MKHIALILAMVFALMLTGCAEQDQAAAPERSIPVTVAEVRSGDVAVRERTVGRIEAATAPTVAAEVPGRIVEILKDAGDTVSAGELLARIDDTNVRNAVQRLEALHTQAQRTVTRFRNLVEKDSASQSLLDEAEAQLAALTAQLDDGRTALRRTRVVAPVDGVIQRRMISVGDFRGVGDPLFQVSGSGRLRIVLPFPERLAGQLEVGQQVALESPTGAGSTTAGISELRPMVGVGSRAVEAIVEIDNPGGWRPGGSASASVVLQTRRDQALVPAQAVVQRPAGSVVYVVSGNTVTQRLVQLGIRVNGEVEVLEGVRPGEQVVVDGAGFLTDGARVEVRR